VRRAARPVKNRTALIVTSDDGLAQENDAFAAALRKADDAHVTTRHFATDHACSDKRIELSQTALEWLAGLPNQVLGARWERRGVQVIARQAGVAAREAGALRHTYTDGRCPVSSAGGTTAARHTRSSIGEKRHHEFAGG